MLIQTEKTDELIPLAYVYDHYRRAHIIQIVIKEVELDSFCHHSAWSMERKMLECSRRREHWLVPAMPRSEVWRNEDML